MSSNGHSDISSISDSLTVKCSYQCIVIQVAGGQILGEEGNLNLAVEVAFVCFLLGPRIKMQLKSECYAQVLLIVPLPA